MRPPGDANTSEVQVPAALSAIPQYTAGTILLVWAAAALPMAVLGWVVAPALALRSTNPVFARLAVLTVGLIWQFAVVMLLLYREAGTWQWPILSRRLWLNGPRSPRTGEPRPHLWWWLVPLCLLSALFDLRVKGILDGWWAWVFPSLAEPPGWALASALATPEARSQLVGAWGTGALFLVSALFNTLLGEELLFRGLLLPRMAGACGRADWAANGFLFGIYHLHQPWGIVSSLTHGILLFALPTRYFRSAWFGIVAHSGQSIFFAFLMLGLILGLA